MLCWIILQNILITWMCCPLIWWVENEIGFSHVFNIHRHRQLLCKLRQNILYDYMINVSKWIYLWWLCVILVSCVELQEPLYKIFSKISSVFSMPRYVFPVFCDTWIKITLRCPNNSGDKSSQHTLTLFSITQIWIMLLVSNSLLSRWPMFTITGNLRCRP